MLPSVLANLTLGYQMLWNRQRRSAGVLLFADANTSAMVDGTHLLDILAQEWSEHSGRLVLLPQSASLLADVLAHARSDGPWIGVESLLAADPLVMAQIANAHTRGVQLAWRGGNAPGPDAALADYFAQRVVTLGAAEALLALHAMLHPEPGAPGTPQNRPTSPTSPSGPVSPVSPVSSVSSVRAGHVYEAVASRALVDHCLDDQGVWAVAGWPTDDVLHRYGGQTIAPGHQVIGRLVEATDIDMALERIEHILSEDPVLAVRFLRYANSAALGLRSSVDSLRHGLMVLGLSTFRQWLLGQLTNASDDVNLLPVRASMVLRARTMELLLDAGEEDTLRSEVRLCGLLSQIDLLIGEPLASVLQHLPVSERVAGAVLSNSGPYAPFLEIARALEYPAMGGVLALCETHGIDLADVNRSLLRALAQPPSWPLNARLRG